MAKKKQRKKIYKIPEPKLEKIFNCPECGRKKVVEVRFNKKENKGYLRCRACGDNYEAKLKKASAPIDVYYEWIDFIDKERENEYNEKINDEENEDPEHENFENENNEGDNDDDNDDEDYQAKPKNKYDDDDDEDY